ncbi:SAM-dependent methyltransferase [Streptomyces lushanensis]|uniref:SAM-dependent methyltransferase n=1 Tax=Streptomyces lushanensis TaxID=1434255 RepID=UPI00082BA1EF|nr:SAM-dependent methyltransferase [Streptomyces lushanensis]
MSDTSPTSRLKRRPPTGVDTSVPHSARIWNHWQGGKDNYEVDRQAGDAYAAAAPGIVPAVRASRDWLRRAVRWTVSEGGVNQLLDIGAGIPIEPNVHEIAQDRSADARVVYVDHDPMVLLHVGALLDSTPEGATDYLEADMRETDRVITQAARTLDFSRPVALVFSDVLGHIPDLDEAYALVRRLVGATAPGSLLVLSHAVISPQGAAAQDDYNESGAIPYILRTPRQIGGFFDGLDLVEPGLVPMPDWRPDPNTDTRPLPGVGWGALARIG